MNKIIPSLLIFPLFLTHPVISQETKPRTYFIEAGGSGGFGSLNFDKEFSIRAHYRWSYRLGAGYSPGASWKGKIPVIIIFPTLINFLYGKQKHFLEAGAGQGLAFNTQGAIYSRLTLNAGYRFQKKEGGFFLRIVYSPLISFMYDRQWEHWAGIGIGFTFVKKKCPCEDGK